MRGLVTYDYRCDSCARRVELRVVRAHRDYDRGCTAPDCNGGLQRMPTVSRVAEVRGTGNGAIGRAIEDRAKLGAMRRAEWE